MFGMNLIYNPDHHQVLEYHKELLKKAEAHLAHSVVETPKCPTASFRKWLLRWFSDPRSIKMVQATHHSPRHHT